MSDESQQPSIRSLDAVVLIANDSRRQCAFYGNILGLPAKDNYQDAAFFSVGNQSLAVFAGSHHPEGAERLKGGSHGVSHLEFGIRPSD
jgi:catechol-2,3-dioxygenase